MTLTEWADLIIATAYAEGRESVVSSNFLKGQKLVPQNDEG